MHILDYLARLVTTAEPPPKMLRSAAQAIARDMGAKSCRLFLGERSGALVLGPSFAEDAENGSGADATALAAEALACVSLVRANTRDGTLLAVPVISRTHRLGAIVVECAGHDRPFREEELDRLSAVAAV